jgi:drug/metabolite transporter (DMT)-like permease
MLVGVAFTAAPFLLYAIAAKTTGSAILAICNGATPFVTALAAHAVLGDRLTARRLAGVGVGFIGLAVLVWPEARKGFEGSSLFGVLIAIFGAALYAGGNVVTRLAPRLSPLMSSFIIVGSGAICAIGCALLLAPFPVGASAESILAVAFLGLLPTGVAMVMYVWLIQRAGAVFVSFSTYLSPLWATLIGVTFMNEELRWSMAGSLALILAGVAIANWTRRST